jgi:hypothetical protein
VNHTLKMIMLSGALALSVMMFGCTSAQPAEQANEHASVQEVAAPASGNVCDQFCQSQGGPNYLLLFATSESQCNSKGGDWYTDDQGYTGPPPGCCCSCRRPGFCL